MGFTAKAMVREYSFLVRESSIDCQEVTFTILNEAFASRRLSFQNGPDICSLKLHRELADSANNPLKTHYRISETELNAYHDSHPPRAAKGLYPRKVAQEFYGLSLNSFELVLQISGKHTVCRINEREKDAH